jgi:hypothetical protein
LEEEMVPNDGEIVSQDELKGAVRGNVDELGFTRSTRILGRKGRRWAVVSLFALVAVVSRPRPVFCGLQLRKGTKKVSIKLA